MFQYILPNELIEYIVLKSIDYYNCVHVAFLDINNKNPIF